MALLADVNLTNALAATTAAFWGRDYDPTISIVNRSPYLNMLRARGRVFDTEAFKTGTQIYTQTIGSSTHVTNTTISATNEFLQIPTYLEYNLSGIQKKLILKKDQVQFLQAAGNPLKSGKDAKKKEAYVRAGARDLRERFMALHFRQMMYDINASILTGTAGSAAKSLEDVISPSTGPSTSFEGEDLTGLDVTINRPLWMAANTGTGATGIGPTLTGAATMTYAEMLKSVSYLIQTQQRRTVPYNLIIVGSTAYNYLSNLAENRIQYTAPPGFAVTQKNVENTLLGKGGIPLQSHIAAITMNGIPVLEDPSNTDNNVWLLNTDTINLDVFDPEAKDGQYYNNGPLADMEALIRVYARFTSTTASYWAEDAVVAMACYYQQVFNDFGAVGLVVFDSTSSS